MQKNDFSGSGQIAFIDSETVQTRSNDGGTNSHIQSIGLVAFEHGRCLLLRKHGLPNSSPIAEP